MPRRRPKVRAVATERASQQKSYSDISEVVKRARLLAAEAEQTRTSITARQRHLFTHTVFTQAASLASPALWINVIHEAPGTASAVQALFRDWFTSANNRLEPPRATLFWGSMAFICLGYVLLTQFARRVLARDSTPRNPAVSSRLSGLGGLPY